MRSLLPAAILALTVASLLATSTGATAGPRAASFEELRATELGSAVPLPHDRGKERLAQAQAPKAGDARPLAPSTTALRTETYGDWVRECAGPKDKAVCILRQTVRDGKKRRIISFLAARKSETTYLELLLPLGLSIPYGVTLDLSPELRVPAQLVDCAAAGCRAVLALDDAKLALLKSAKSISVSFQDSRSGKIISISGSVKGLNEGLSQGFGKKADASRHPPPSLSVPVGLGRQHR